MQLMAISFNDRTFQLVLIMKNILKIMSFEVNSCPVKNITGQSMNSYVLTMYYKIFNINEDNFQQK